MNTKKAALSALAYHDIFEYPLSIEELSKFLEVKSDEDALKKALTILEKNKLIKKEGEYFSLSKKKLMYKRNERYRYSKNKKIYIKLYTLILSMIPSINLVGLTGALAMDNSKKNDDIDLLIISSKNSLWTTRFLANILLFPFKRKPKEEKQNNKACLNIFLDKKSLAIKNQSLYTAHELAQMKVLLNRNKTYEKLIKTNKWIYNFLPNWTPSVQKPARALPLATSPRILELFLAKLQQKYMKSKRTSETIGRYQLFFHPLDLQEKILKKHTQKMKSLTKNKNF